MLDSPTHSNGRKVSKRRANGPHIPLPEDPHPIVGGWLERERTADEAMRKRGVPSSPYGLSKSFLGRRQICVQDALLKRIEARGHVVVPPRDHLAPLVALVHGQRISWDLHERYWRRKVLVPRQEETGSVAQDAFKYALVASGFLSLTIEADYCSRQDMHEQHRQLFDHRIDEILDRFEAKAVHAIQKRNSWDDWERRVQERRAHRERMEILAGREEDRWDRLQQSAANWKEAALLRDFVEGIGLRMNALNDKPVRAELWLKWARQRVNALDPFQRDARTLYEEVIAKPGRGSLGLSDAGSEEMDDEDRDLGD